MVLLQAAPSWDLVITLVFVIGISYGFIILRDRVLVLLLSLYAGTALANTLAGPIQKFFNGDVALLNKLWVESSVSPFAIKMFVFAAAVVLICAKSGLAARRTGVSFFELAAYSFFSVCVGISSVFGFMEPDRLKLFTDSSKMASFIVNHQLLWIIAPFIILALLGGGYSRSSYPPEY
jgi:hypothetical protein